MPKVMPALLLYKTKGITWYNSYICLPFPLFFFPIALPTVLLNLTGALVALFGLRAGVRDDIRGASPLLRMDSSVSRANCLSNSYYIIITSASWAASSSASSTAVRFLFFTTVAIVPIFYWIEMDLRLLAIVTVEGRVINLALANSVIGISKSSWVFIASKAEPWWRPLRGLYWERRV